jgi:hypothetical protein
MGEVFEGLCVEVKIEEVRIGEVGFHLGGEK